MRNRGKGKEVVADDFATRYPTITYFVKNNGWVTIGSDEYSRSLVRAVNEGGMVWDGETRYPTMDAALVALEAAIGKSYGEIE